MPVPSSVVDMAIVAAVEAVRTMRRIYSEHAELPEADDQDLIGKTLPELLGIASRLATALGMEDEDFKKYVDPRDLPWEIVPFWNDTPKSEPAVVDMLEVTDRLTAGPFPGKS